MKKFINEFGKLIRSEKGQGIVEYILVLALVFSIFMLAKPTIMKLQTNFAKGAVVKGSWLDSENRDPGGYYYFPMK